MSCFHICYLCHFWVLVHWSYFYQLHVMFSISYFVCFDEIYAKLYSGIDINDFIIVVCFVNVFHCTNFIFLQEIFQVFQLTFSFFHDNVNRYTITWVVKSTDDIIQCLSMGIYSHLQRDHFWKHCLVMIQFIWMSHKT